MLLFHSPKLTVSLRQRQWYATRYTVTVLAYRQWLPDHRGCGGSNWMRFLERKKIPFQNLDQKQKVNWTALDCTTVHQRWNSPSVCGERALITFVGHQAFDHWVLYPHLHSFFLSSNAGWNNPFVSLPRSSVRMLRISIMIVISKVKFRAHLQADDILWGAHVERCWSIK